MSLGNRPYNKLSEQADKLSGQVKKKSIHEKITLSPTGLPTNQMC